MDGICSSCTVKQMKSDRIDCRLKEEIRILINVVVAREHYSPEKKPVIRCIVGKTFSRFVAHTESQSVIKVLSNSLEA